MNEPLTETISHADTTAEHASWAAVGGLDSSYLSAEPDQQHGEDRRSTAASTEPDLTRLVQPAGLPREVRALWVTRWDFRTAGDIAVIAERAAGAHFNALFFQVRGNADAYYASQLEPWAARLTGALGQDPGWDPLAVAVSEGHGRGLEVHAWLNVYPAWLSETPPPPAEPEPMFLRFNRLFGEDWVVWNRNQEPMQLNKEYLWSNPGHWAVKEHIASVGYDVAARYLVDGLHLDNVRYPGWEYSRDPITLAAVEEARLTDPSVDRKSWQRQQVDALVSAIHSGMQHLKPGLPLSAAVWPVYKDTWEWWGAGDGYNGFCQDSVGWVEAGSAQLICPMLYLSSITTDDLQFEALVKDFVARAGGNHVAAGITTTYDDFAVIARRIDLARQAGCAGQALFSYAHINQHGYWDALREGPYATPAIL
jgi:uncharacterized lipoprotein YddW (UPF0748 family)